MNEIFLVGADGALQRMRRTDYADEDLFQTLLADHPALLDGVCGGQGLLLVTREAGIPDEGGAADRWSLDHLFLDRQGVPVLVEVKRASDTRARREVVAQMLDYAAHMSAYWQAGRVAAEHRAACEAVGREPVTELATFLGDTVDQEDWWRRVEANIASGRLRLVFVADRISKELRRIVEFLNEQMRPAEVLAVEIEQYLSPGGTRTLVPRVLGDTEKARGAKAVDAGAPRMSDDEWWEAFERANGAAAREAAARILAWFDSRGCRHVLKEPQASIAILANRDGGRLFNPFFIRNNGGIDLGLQSIRNVPAFASDQARTALASRFRGLPGLGVQWTGKATGWPSFPVERLLDEESWTAFTGFAEDLLARFLGEAKGDVMPSAIAASTLPERLTELLSSGAPVVVEVGAERSSTRRFPAAIVPTTEGIAWIEDAWDDPAGYSGHAIHAASGRLENIGPDIWRIGTATIRVIGTDDREETKWTDWTSRHAARYGSVIAWREASRQMLVNLIVPRRDDGDR